MADNCRMLLATAYRGPGEDEAVLEQFTQAIDADPRQALGWADVGHADAAEAVRAELTEPGG